MSENACGNPSEWQSRLQAAGVLSDGECLVPSTVLELVEDLHAHVQELANVKVVLQDKLTHVIVENRRLKGESDLRLKGHERKQDALEVLEYWSEVCDPGARELESPSRLGPVIARLTAKGTPWTVEELKRCAYGYSKFPFVIDGRRMPQGPPGREFVDVDVVFKDAKHVKAGLNMAEEADRREQVIPEIFTPEDGMQLSELGQAAVSLADYGFYVFPVRARNKFPVTEHGLKDATRDTDRIMRCWRNWPDLNVAVRCGKESDIFVLDVDGDEGMESLRALEAEHGSLPRTLSVVTPRGGSHFYWRHPGVEIRNTEGFPGFGLDIRGDGGYCLAPPSIGPNGNRYEVDERVEISLPPEWLVELLVNYQSTMRQVDVEEYAKIFEGLPKGQRNSRMTQYVGRLWHKHTPPEVLGIAMAVNRTYCRPPLPDRDVKRIVDSISRREERKTRQTIKMRLEGAAS